MSSKPVSATIETPMSFHDKGDVAVEEIPLPPPEMWGELAGEEKVETDAQAAQDAPAVQEAEELDFVGTGHEIVIPLKHPFRRNGQVVETITVRRLRIGELDGVLKRVGVTKVSFFDIYAQMTGFPAPVLRGLIDEDGNAVTDAAYSFLPRDLKTDAA